MATVVDPTTNLVKLDSGKTVNAQMGGWYDGQQYWGGTLSAPGVFNTQNNQAGQQGAAYVAPQDQAYIQQRQATYKPSGGSQEMPGITGVGATTDGTGLGMGGIAPAPTLNLPGLYDELYAKSGVSEIEKSISEKTKAYNEAVASIKDNPYLSEATMTGRLSKLESKFGADTQALKNDIATKKADIEMRLNLETKQFDINSQVAKQALDQFSSLLDSGALNNANGEDIASITKSTGLSSNVILSAIQQKKLSNLSTEIKSFDDGVNEGFIIYSIDQQGNIVNQTKQVTGKSSKSNVGNYSTDPVVSSFIEKYVKGGSDISSLWEGLY